MNKVNEKIGTDYKPFNYYGAPDAEKVIIAMGSVCETIEESDRLPRTQPARRLALLRFAFTDRSSAKYLLDVLPETVKTISVLDRTKEPGSIGEPLYLDVLRCYSTARSSSGATVLTGRYGLGSKDTTPGRHHRCLPQHGKAATMRRSSFTIGIEDDVTQPVPRSQTSTRTPPRQAHSPASSGASALTVPSARTRTPSRSSATTPICTHRVTSPMTPRSPAV